MSNITSLERYRMRAYARAGLPFDDSTSIGDGMTLAIAQRPSSAAYSHTQPTDPAVCPVEKKSLEQRLLSAEDIAELRKTNPLEGPSHFVVDQGNDPIAAYDLSGVRHGSAGIREYKPILPN